MDVTNEETILNEMKNIFDGVDRLSVGRCYQKSVNCCPNAHFFVCAMAACNGHFKILKWAHANGFMWHNCSICANAAKNGHLDILYYLYENEAPYGTRLGIHPNCKEFFDTYGEYWKKGDFTYDHNYNLKPAKG